MATSDTPGQSKVKPDPVVVVAIDIGTTYSGYAFSFHKTFTADPLKVTLCKLERNQDDQGEESFKIPSSILFSPDKHFVKFGWEAEDSFALMCDKEREEGRKYYLFRGFKEELLGRKNVNKDMEIPDWTKQKSMKALDVFSAAIRCLKDHAIAELQKQRKGITRQAINWVLTVPSLWDETAWQFMREAAIKADISNDHLILALEPEAASVYCQHYFRKQGDASFTEPGQSFITVDCGGGTIDICVFEVESDGRLKQLIRSEGGDYGGYRINKTFETIINKILGPDEITSVRQMDMMELLRSFEISKTNIGIQGRVIVKMPLSMIKLVKDRLKDSEYKERVRIARTNLILERPMVDEMFAECETAIRKSINKVFMDDRCKKPLNIVLVGGLSKSKAIQRALKEAFPASRVLVTTSAEASVVTGAVMHGHFPEAITARVAALDCRRSFIKSKQDHYIPKLKSDPVLVIAIDFGTTYSGYAYSFHSNFKTDPLKIETHTLTRGQGGPTLQTFKVPTCVLFNPQKEFVAFGSEAEDQYTTMCDNNRDDAKKWYFFHRFKMELYAYKNLSHDLTLLDKTGKKSMRALDVFSASIGYVKSHALSQLQQRGSLVLPQEITWVLTVPAIWDDGARQFMREAATMAGIPNDQVILALEPEAASVFCKQFFEKQQKTSEINSFVSRGKRFMTVDCGGGTVDISVFEVGYEGTLNQLHRPKGADCGGVMVDKSFQECLNQILGFEGMATIENMELLELNRSFESSKRFIGSSETFAVTLPSTIVECVTCHLRKSKYNDRVRILRNKLLMNKNVAEGFFKQSQEGIIDAIKEVLGNQAVENVDVIFLVGGYSESPIIQHSVQEAFPDVYILVPPSPAASVVMGAVLYGHCPTVITCRVAAFTYGVAAHNRFVDGVHDPNKLLMLGNVRWCKDIFDIFIHVNDTVFTNKTTIEKEFRPLERGQTSVLKKIYRSSKRSPMYVTEDGCELIGEFRVMMPDLTGETERRNVVSMSVSGTELTVTARDGNSGMEFATTCDFLSHPA